MNTSKGFKPESSRSVADTTMANSPELINQLTRAGWSTHMIKATRKHGFIYEPYLVMHRSVISPVYQNQNVHLIPEKLPAHFPESPISGKSPEFGDFRKPLSLNSSRGSLCGGKTKHYGYVAHSDLAPITDTGMEAENAFLSKHADADGGTLGISLDSIQTIRDMRLPNASFVLGFDSEFYYDSTGLRYILSWQFSFVHPETPNKVEQILVFSKNGERLRFSVILNFIIETFNLYPLFVPQKTCDGISYYSTRRWTVPIMKKSGRIVNRAFDNFKAAVNACCDPDVRRSLNDAGPGIKAKYEYIDGPHGLQQVILNPVKGYAIGYDNVYNEANKYAMPVTLVCHAGTADLTTLNFDSPYEKDILLRVSQVQGGLVSLSDYYMHTPLLSKYYNFYPIRLTIRDTMCFAPADMKKLEDLGRTINVPKLEIPSPYAKHDMLAYMEAMPVDFGNYAVNDAMITVLYCSELWGVNKAMPVTISSAAGRAAIPIIAEYFGLDRDDREGFNAMYRGLHTVKHGKVMQSNGSGFLQNTSLEPLDSQVELFQLYARNAYKGGYNASIKIGYFPWRTYDYDLHNAYLTSMALVPDVDWENCIAMELQYGQKLTLDTIQSPYDPVFAVVDFKFPSCIKFPCIPITVDGSMIYPLTGNDVYAAAPELYLALRLGADITIKRLLVGNIKIMPDGSPSHCLRAVVSQFVNDRSSVQRIYGKGSLLDLLEKMAGNSIYGKTAQDVIDKSTWSSAKEQMVNIGASPITSPVHSCLTTSGVRAVLLAAMNQAANLGYDVYSVTTDGFISNIPFETLQSLDLYGFTSLFQEVRKAMTGNSEMWQLKHQQDDLINLTTRGNASLNDGSDGGLPGVMAHNSYVSGEIPDSYADRETFITAVLDRVGRVVCWNKSFAHFKDMARRENRIDFVVTDRERHLSMDFDLKRKPVKSSMYTENPIVGNVEKEIACIDTIPYETISEYEHYKLVGTRCEVRRTESDWDIFFQRIAGQRVNSSKVRVKNTTDLNWDKLISVIMAARLKVPLEILNGDAISLPILNSPNLRVEQKIIWINGFNTNPKKTFNKNTWKDCCKQTRVSRMLPESQYVDLLQAMMNWTPADGSPLSSDSAAWDIVEDLYKSA